jgi:hypothetical protein
LNGLQERPFCLVGLAASQFQNTKVAEQSGPGGIDIGGTIRDDGRLDVVLQAAKCIS